MPTGHSDIHPPSFFKGCVTLTFKTNHHIHLALPGTTAHSWWSLGGGTLRFSYLRINLTFKDVEWLGIHMMSKVIIKFNFSFVSFCMGDRVD